LNLPNILSLFRLCLVPVFPLVFFSEVPNANLWAALIYAIAAGTDVLDGVLARRLHKVTRLGRILDPLADKLMGASVIVCVAVRNPFLWWAAGLFCVKEALMGVGALVQYKKIDDVPPSDLFGKCAVSFFFGACLAILIFEEAMTVPAKQMLMGMAMLLSVAALLRYLRRFLKLTKQQQRQ